MSNVRLTIGGRNFLVACAEGEERHVAALGQMIDGKVTGSQDVSTLSESRVLLYAALLLADELHEARVASEQRSAFAALSDETAGRLNAIAEKIENLAQRLESPLASA